MIIEIDPTKLQQTVEQYELRLLVYYGSYARVDDYDPEQSDIDIAFISRKELSIKEMNNLLTDLILLHRKSEIDLVNLKTASGLLKQAVADDGKVLYEESTGFFHNLCPYLYKSYYETIKFRQTNREIFQKKLMEDLRNVRHR